MNQIRLPYLKVSLRDAHNPLRFDKSQASE